VPRFKIISGGQSGVDRAALDAAIELGISHGGWCPKNRLAEDGAIPRKYHLRETDSSNYAVRTRWNVRDSGGTLILYREPLEGGTRFTWECTLQFNKPAFLVELGFPPLADAFYRWREENSIATLNIAGPRESQRPGIYSAAKQLLLLWLKPCRIF
jgi:hypothetical protein